MTLRLLDSSSKDFDRFLEALTQRRGESGGSVDREVITIIDAVRRWGDRALVELTQKFDGVKISTAGLRVMAVELAAVNFADVNARRANAGYCVGLLDDLFAEHNLEEWCEILSRQAGQWDIVNSPGRASRDPDALANGYVQRIPNAGANDVHLVASPVQFDEEPAVPGRAPGFNEHGDSILAGIGLDEDAIIDLKVRGVVA